MFYLLLFINLLFAGVIDTCTADKCSLKSDIDGVATQELVGDSADVKSFGAGLGAEYNVVISDASTKELRDEKIKLGAKASAVSKKVMDLIAGHNLGLNLTTAQINSLKNTHANSKAYLQDNQPWAAKAEINATTPDGVMVTQELIDQANAIFTESGLPGL